MFAYVLSCLLNVFFLKWYVQKLYFCFIFVELPEAECSAVGSRMPFCSQEEQESRLGLLSVAELSLGLQSLSLPCWEQPWDCAEPELPVRPSSPGSSEYHGQCGAARIQRICVKYSDFLILFNSLVLSLLSEPS